MAQQHIWLFLLLKYVRDGYDTFSAPEGEQAKLLPPGGCFKVCL